MANFGGTAFGDIALVPGPFMKNPQAASAISAEWYMSTTSRRDYIHYVFERQCEIAIANLHRIHDAVGDQVDAVFLCGTDFGTQTSTFCSVATFRELYFPYYKRLNDWIHRHTELEDASSIPAARWCASFRRSSRPASTFSIRCNARPREWIRSI